MRDEHEHTTGQPASSTTPPPATDSLLVRIVDLKERYEQHLARARATARIAEALYQEAHDELHQLHQLQAAQETAEAEQAE